MQVHTCFCSRMVLIMVKSSPGKKKKGHGSLGSQLKYSLFTDKTESLSPEQRTCAFAYTSFIEHLSLCSSQAQLLPSLPTPRFLLPSTLSLLPSRCYINQDEAGSERESSRRDESPVPLTHGH